MSLGWTKTTPRGHHHSQGHKRGCRGAQQKGLAKGVTTKKNAFYIGRKQLSTMVEARL